MASSRKTLDEAGRKKLFELLPELVETRQKRDAIRQETRAERKARKAARTGDEKEGITARVVAEELGVTKYCINMHVNYVLFNSLEALIEQGGPEVEEPLDVATAVNIVELVKATGLGNSAISAMFSRDLLYLLPDWMDWREECGQPFAHSASVMDFIPNKFGIVEKYPQWNVAYIDELVRAETDCSLRDALLEHELTLHSQRDSFTYKELNELADLKLYKHQDDRSLREKAEIVIDSCYRMRKISNREIANELNMQVHEVLTMVNFLELHDEEELRALPECHYPAPYSNLELSWILDFMEATNLSQKTVAAVFKIESRHVLRGATRRKTVGLRGFLPFVANVPESTDLQALDELIAKKNNGATFSELVDKFYAQFNTDAKQAARDALELYLNEGRDKPTKEEVDAAHAALEASLEANNPYHYAVVDFESKRIAPPEEELSEDESSTEDALSKGESSEEDVGAKENTGEHSTRKGVWASSLYAQFCNEPEQMTRDELATLMHDLILEETGYDIGMLASEYLETCESVVRAGRQPKVNPFSEKFASLPMGMRESSMRYLLYSVCSKLYADYLVEPYLETLNKPFALSKDRVQRACEVYEQIQSRMPKKFTKAGLYKNLNINQDHVNYYRKH